MHQHMACIMVLKASTLRFLKKGPWKSHPQKHTIGHIQSNSPMQLEKKNLAGNPYGAGSPENPIQAP